MDRKVLVIAPEWKNENFVGNYRIGRYLNWFEKLGYSCVVISAGEKDFVRETSFGQEIILSLPNYKWIYLYNKIGNNLLKKIVRSLSQRYFTRFTIPDKFIYLEKRLFQKLNKFCEPTKFDFVISSSPPESSHVIAYMIANHYSIKLLIDMRDGWIDEPLKPILRNSKRRYQQEADLELKILAKSEIIFVTSPEWKELLTKRYPNYKNKIVVLYNAYPKINKLESSNKINKKNELIYSGRFRGSSFRRTPNMIFDQLTRYIDDNNIHMRIELVGDFGRKDLSQLKSLQKSYSRFSCDLSLNRYIPRDQLFEILNQKNGFLLLSASIAAIPSKLYEYLYFNKPILAFAPTESPIGRLAKEIEHLIIIDYEKDYLENKTNFKKYFDLLSDKARKFEKPIQFYEQEISKIFTAKLKEVLDKSNEAC